MRIALLLNLAPRMQGSFEQWVLAFASEAIRRRHALDLFGRGPVHPSFAAELGQLGVRWYEINYLTKSPARAALWLARYDLLDLTLISPLHPYALVAYAAYPAHVIFLSQLSGGVEGRAPYPSLLSLPRALLDRLVSARLTGVAGVSEYVRARDQRRFVLPARKVRTIYHGVDLDRFKARRARNRATSGARILLVAHLIPEKGGHCLIRALAQMRDPTARLQIVGDGPDEAMLRRLASEMRVASRVSFWGFRNDVQDFIDEADIFVHPALWAEAFGFTIAEAMASEKAIIASRVGAIPELIENGVTGLLVEPGNVQGLARALDRLNEDAAYRLRLGRNARQRAAALFELHRSVQAHLDWYEALVDPHRHSPSAKAVRGSPRILRPPI